MSHPFEHMLVKFGSFPQDLGSINQMNPKHLRWFQWQILKENQDCLPSTKILWGFGCYFLYNVALKRGDVNQNFYQVTESSRILVLKRNQMHKLDSLPNSPKCYQSTMAMSLDVWTFGTQKVALFFTISQPSIAEISATKKRKIRSISSSASTGIGWRASWWYSDPCGKTSPWILQWE